MNDETADELALWLDSPEPVDPADLDDAVMNCECTDTRTETDERDGTTWTVCNRCETAWQVVTDEYGLPVAQEVF